MNILAINTVGQVCEAAVVAPAISVSRAEEMTRGHDSRLPIIVERVLEQSGLTWAGIDRIGVVTGPGSFAGIRVGVAFAHGLSLALNRPALGVTTLEATGAPRSIDSLAILPARRRPPGQSWWVQQLQDGIGVRAPEEVEEDRLLELAGDSGQVYGLAPPEALAARCEARPPSAENAAALCKRLSETEAPARPVYARAPDAEPMKPLGGAHRQ